MCGMKNLAAYDREAYATILHKYTRLSHISIAPRELKMCVCAVLLISVIFLDFSHFLIVWLCHYFYAAWQRKYLR